jgi:hypothetical protein
MSKLLRRSLTILVLAGLLVMTSIVQSGAVSQATSSASCADSVCLFPQANFGGVPFNAGFPAMTCATTPFPALSATNDIVFHVELYKDTSCTDFVYFLESGKSNPNLSAPVRSYKTFICGRDC